MGSRGKVDSERAISGKNIAEGTLALLGFIFLIAFVITVAIGMIAQAT